MDKELITEMNNFCKRVLKGEEVVNMQETAIVPKILEILKSLPEEEATGNKNSVTQQGR